MAVKTVAELISAAPDPADLDASAEWFADVQEYAASVPNTALRFDAETGLMFCNVAPRVVEYVRNILAVLKSINN